jgi:hypothetical protein
MRRSGQNGDRETERGRGERKSGEERPRSKTILFPARGLTAEPEKDTRGGHRRCHKSRGGEEGGETWRERARRRRR